MFHIRFKRFLAGTLLLGISMYAGAQNNNDWGNVEYKGAPWVSNISRPFEITKGLNNRHLSIGTSHGRYFNVSKDEWGWQRPRLYGTAEDLFTQTFTVPYIIPMLERAGAIVYSPRERDWQKEEAIVDNDGGIINGKYTEENGRRKWQESDYAGFAHLQNTYENGENPFITGTARICATTTDERNASTVQWTPNIPNKGRYAVYVSYQSFLESANDAHYTVYHDGGITEFQVNQQMGGGTWVYLGTFDFAAGENPTGKVILSNVSRHKGVVSADGVRFGGGMGNIARGPFHQKSGLPRYLEGARYNAQWSGFPSKVYNMYEGQEDYKDDINVRSFTTNYLNGGSVYCPDSMGLHVPIEGQYAFHSDAGYTKDSTFVGPITICSTDNDTIYNYPGGISRQVSYNLAAQMLFNACRDINRSFGINWPAREVRNSNYSESRRGDVPSIIFEMLSHQNWADMRYGHDPNFKFTLARSIYKTILRFVNGLHGRSTIVAPLPIRAFGMQWGRHDNEVQLSWQPTSDSTEEESRPTSYVLYTRMGNGGFDNGQIVRGNNISVNLETGKLYSFKVTAVNEGGESMDSEILSAYIAPRGVQENKTVLIINGFDRLSGPKPINTDTEIGFDLNTDAGVPYLCTPGFAGAQIGFDKSKLGRETFDGAGYTGRELEGKLIAGNTFDYPVIHGNAIIAAGDYSFLSSSREAVTAGFVKMADFAMVDLILGLQKDDGWSIRHYKTFDLTFQQLIGNYMNRGGRFLVSGAFLGSDMLSPTDREFIYRVLKYGYDTTLEPSVSDTSILTGCGINFAIPRRLNEKQYAVQTCDALRPVADGGFASFAYTENNRCAGIAYNKGNYRVMALGFPFESVMQEKDRNTLMAAMLQFLLK